MKDAQKQTDSDGMAGHGIGLRLTLVVAVLGAAGLGFLALQGHRSASGEVDLQPTLIALSTELAEARAQAASSGSAAQDNTPLPSGSSDPLQASPAAGGMLFYSAGQPGHAQLRARPLAGGDAIPLSGGPDDREPALAPDGTTIAFRSHRDGQWDLYLLQLASGELRRLTDTAGYEGHPTWSPDGRWLAFEAESEGDLDIWILAIDGSSPAIQLTNHAGLDAEPHWDPSAGRRIAFVSDRAGSRDIYLADLDRPTDRHRNLTQTPELAESAPAFSPDGSQLAYSAHNRGLDLLWTLNPDRLDDEPVQRGPGTTPVWSPDGTVLLAALRSAHGEHLAAYALASDPAPGVALAQRGLPLAVEWGVPSSSLTAAAELDPAFVAGDGARTQVPQQQLGRMSLVALQDLEAPNPSLIEAADEPFNQLRQRTAELVGWDFLGSLDHAFVGLNDPLPPGFAYNDWLYTGRAFAFTQQSHRADWVEVVREDVGGQTFWRVFVRAARQDGSLGEPLRHHPWDFDARYRGDPGDYDEGGRRAPTIPGAYYVDFTALAEAHGFERQPALNNWQTFLPGARFNEFAYTGGLSWEQAMLQLYPQEAIATPTPFSSPSPTPTNTPWPTATPWWWRWRTPTPSLPPTQAVAPSPTP